MGASLTTTTPLALRVVDVTRTYMISGKPVPALRGVSLEVPRGAFIALEGRSGSGKTTLLNVVGGLDQPTTGEVELYGRRLSTLSQEQLTLLRREQLGFIFQSFALLPIFSAFENVEVPLRIEGKLSREERHARVRQALALVGIEQQAAHRPPELSAWRVTIVRCATTPTWSMRCRMGGWQSST